MNNKGMEMWELVTIILVILLLLFVAVWYSGLNQELSKLLEKMAGLF